MGKMVAASLRIVEERCKSDDGGDEHQKEQFDNRHLLNDRGIFQTVQFFVGNYLHDPLPPCVG